MSKITFDDYSHLSQRVGLRFDEKNNVLFGEYGGYSVIVSAAVPNQPRNLSVQFSVFDSLNARQVKELKKTSRAISGAVVKGRSLQVMIKPTGNLEVLCDRLEEVLRGVTAFLRQVPTHSCCQVCGGEGSAAYSTGSGYALICDTCGEKLNRENAYQEQVKAAKKENVAGGIVGAFLGTFLGALSIVLIGQLGFVSALSGVLIAVCTLKGYELLGGKLSKKGAVICCIVMIIGVYVGDRMDWALLIWRELKDLYDISVFNLFRAIPDMLKEGILDSGAYTSNLLKTYFFMLLGAVPTIRASFRNATRVVEYRKL